MTRIQQLGGGLVAFDDDTYGFYTIDYAFGDGTFGTSADPTHQFPGSGSYPLLVIARNACGNDTVTVPVDPCISAVIARPPSACLGVPALFHENSGLAHDSLRWLVNGVPTVAGDTFIWTPPATGNYQIGLIYQDGVCHDTTTMTIAVFSGLPVPSFTYATGTFLTLNFTNTSTNALSYAWDFGDGGTSTATHPSHTYATNSSQTICLTATNGCGSAQSCQTWSCPFPVAAFTASPNGPLVTITDQSTGTLSMTWDFGDGQTATGTVASHTYTTTGTFNICQTVTNNCATVSICHTVLVVATSSAFYRIDFSPLGVSTPKAVACNPAGNNLTVGGSNLGAFMQMTDAMGAVLWTNTYTTANYVFNDVVAMTNGNFLVVGGTNLGGQGSMDGLWLEVDASGTIVTQKTLGTASSETLTGVSADRTGGYLLSSLPNFIAARVDANLNLLWSRNLNTVGAVNGFQAPDNSFWFACIKNNSQTVVRYLHFDATGLPLEEYDVNVGSSGGFNGIGVNKYDCDMACDGTIYFMMSTDEFTSTAGYEQKVGLSKFNTSTHAGTGTLTRLAGGSIGSAPFYDAWPQSLVIKPNGNLLILGYINLIADVNTSPKREKLILDVNASNLAITASAYGGGATQDIYRAGCLLPSGAYLAAGTADDILQMHKFSTNSQCQVSASILNLNQLLEVNNNTPIYTSTFVNGSSVFGTAATASSLVATPRTGVETVACATPCTTPVTAGFTYTVSGNAVTFTSTSTSGANLVWTIPGQSCLSASTFTLASFCGSTPVTLTASNGCSVSTVTQTIVVSSTLSISLGPDQTRCPGTSVTLTPGPGFATYAWSNGSSASSISVNTAGTYMVTVTSTSGCTAADTLNFAYFPAPVVSIGPNQQHCPNAPTTFTATGGFSAYNWNTNATTQAITVTTNTTYSVTATDANGCTATASATLTNLAGSTSVSAGTNQTRCPGVSATFNASGTFASYLWSNGATTQSITVVTPGIYTVTATTANGCSFVSSVLLSNYTVPALSVGANQTVCTGSPATFIATTGFTSYLWSTGATSSAITVTTPGTYTVTATTSNGCTTSASATLSNTSVSIGSNQTVCAGASATFTATSGFTSYLWSTGATTQAITVSTPGTYSVTATNASGCMPTASATLSNYSVPSVSIGGNQTVCTGANATFTATAGFTSYLWSTGATTQAITVTTTGTYGVTATDANGCTATSSATLSNFSVPSVSLGGNQTVCVGANATFTATAGFTSYLWSNGATTQAITVSTVGTYSVTATNANGCTATASASMSNYSVPSVSIGGNQTVCIGANATFTATAGFTSYLWSNGATTQAITVSTVGSYSVTATDANGCTATDAATLGNFASASFSLGPDTTFCPDTTWQLNGPGGSPAYVWSTGATSSGIVVSTAGAYWLHYTDANGCTAADTIVLALSADCVWPGDANHDGVADNQDLLAVGFGFGFGGPTRPNASPSWYGQPAPNWTTALPSLVNHKHPDCDGNGLVDYPDTALIVAHYGLTHNKNTGVTAGVPLFIVPELDSFPAGDTVFFQVHFGDANDLAINAHGLAFSMHIDPQQVTAGTFYARYPSSFLGNGVQELLTLTYPEQGTGNWHVGISRKDQVGRSGAGGVMRVGFLPDVVYPLTSTLGYVPIRLLNPVAVDGDFNAMLLSAMEDSILVFDPVNAVGQPQGLTHWSLYPVPTAGTAVLEISLSAAMEVDAYLIDMHGRKLRSILNAASLGLGSNKVLVETNDLAEGMYFVQLEIDGRRMVKKLVVER